MTNTGEIRFKDRQTECWTYPRICVYEDALVDPEAYFSFLDESPDSNLPLRIYIHIPYCKQFCTFCPYHKSIYGASSGEQQNALFRAFVTELEMYARKRQIAERRVATIYFGGGDPGVISIEQQTILWNALRSNFDLASDVDITMEGTALSFLDPDKLNFFKAQGVSRVSFGIQTFDEAIRPQLNLEPTIGQIHTAIENIGKAALPDFSVDMMYNLPGQSDESFYRDLDLVQDLGAKYIDFYALNLYPNTTYMKQVSQQKYGQKPTNEREIQMYREILRVMRGRGYHQTSSVSVSRVTTRSHLGFDQFLRGYPMIGIGPSSRSFVAGRNYRNHSSDERYIEDVRAGRFPVEAGAPVSSEHEENRPFVFFPIRLRLEWSQVEKSSRNAAIVESLIRCGYASRNSQWLELTDAGLDWVGNIQRLFFSTEERERERRSFFASLVNKRNPYNQDLMGVAKLRSHRDVRAP